MHRSKQATRVQILFSISRGHFENVFPEIIREKEKEKVTTCGISDSRSLREEILIFRLFHFSIFHFSRFFGETV